MAASATPVDRGTLNRNFHVATAHGEYFLRQHRAEVTAPRLREEHRLLAWVAERGIPVAPPLETAAGETAIDLGEHLWSVSRWFAGRPIDRDRMSPSEAAAVGDMHGRLHAVLAGHPASKAATFSMRWDRRESHRLLAEVAKAAREARAEHWILEGIAAQLQYLESEDIQPPSYFARLPCQLVHGDYHDQQVLIDPGGAVCLVADWEMFQTFPRVWEVVRSLGFAKILWDSRLDAYLGAYARHVRLSGEESALAVQLWWQSRVVGTWLWTAHFLEDNQRVAEFLRPTIEGLALLAQPDARERLVERFTRAANAI